MSSARRTSLVQDSGKFTLQIKGSLEDKSAISIEAAFMTNNSKGKQAKVAMTESNYLSLQDPTVQSRSYS